MEATSLNFTTTLREGFEASSDGMSLPQAFYCDPEIFAFDMSVIFPRSWLMVGFEAELPEVGSYIALTIGANPIVLLRAREGIVGFHNTCRHRGSQLIANGGGRVPRLVCPYHKWTYELDGRLIGAPRMGADFVAKDHALKAIEIRMVNGCIYAALTSDAPEFEPFAAAVAEFLEPYHLTDAKLAHQSTMIEQANWKLVMENARECYHCATGHPELKVSFPVAISPGFDFSQNALSREFQNNISRLALPLEPRAGDWWSVGRYPLNPNMETISRDGKPVVNRRLTHILERDIGGVRWATEPNNFCHVLPDYAFMFSAIPLGPQRTAVISKWLVHKDATEGVDYNLDDLIETWTATNLQDRNLAENNQRGVNGMGYSPGPYSKDAEDFVVRFNNWYRAAIQRALA